MSVRGKAGWLKGFIGVFFAVWLLGGLVLSPDSAYACKCVAPKTVEEEAIASHAIFAGKLVERKPGAKLKDGETGEYLIFDVAMMWKGPEKRRITVLHTMSSCSYGFEIGGEYLVYAPGGTPEAPETHLCTRTKGVLQASDDMKELGEPKYRPSVAEAPPGTPEQGARLSAWYIGLGSALILLFGVAAYYLFRKR